MGWFDSIGKESVEQATKNLEPLLRDASNRLGGIGHGLLDRFDGAEITIKIKLTPIPKAKPVE